LLGALEDGVPEEVLIAVDMKAVEENMVLNAGREMMETMHGDSVHAQTLAGIQRAAGGVSVFTTLPGNNQVFNAKTIATPSNKHREVNNRLEGTAKGPVRGNVLPGRSNLLYPNGMKCTSYR
jgi:hypothetical protein